jgi:hypothetical protein
MLEVKYLLSHTYSLSKLLTPLSTLVSLYLYLIMMLCEPATKPSMIFTLLSILLLNIAFGFGQLAIQTVLTIRKWYRLRRASKTSVNKAAKKY